MAAVDDLTELVERAAAAEKTVLTSKWKDEPDVQALIRRTRKAAEEQRQEVRLDTDPDRLSPRWARLNDHYLDLGAQQAFDRPGAPGAGGDRRQGRNRGWGRSAAESSGRGAGGTGRSGRRRRRQAGADRCRVGCVAGQVGPHPGRGG